MAYHWPIFLESENNSDSLNTSGSEKAQPQNPMESFLLRLCATWKDTKTKIIPICSLILGIISRKKRGTILYFVGLLVFSLSIVTLSHFGDSNKMRMTSHARAKTGGLQQHVLSIETGTGKPRRYLNKGSIGHSAAMHRMGSRHSHYSLHYYPPLELNPNEELAAVIAFLAASPSNALPPFIDPTRPLDPRLVLGFDTSRESAISEIAALTRDTWKDYPVVLLSKVSHSPCRAPDRLLSPFCVAERKHRVCIDHIDYFFGQLYSPVGRELKSILSSYSLKSQPLIWELDARRE